MSEENLTNSEQSPEPEEQYEELSKSEAMGGVFTSPGETFEIIGNTPVKNYWLIPVLVSIILGLIATFLFMGDAELAAKTMEKQRQKIREQMEEKVKAGAMTKEEADNALAKAESFTNTGSPFFKIIGFAGALVGPFLILFILSIVYLVILKIMKSQIEFTNVLNVVGLAMLITALGNLLGMVISIIKGDVSSIGLALVLNESSLGAKAYSLVSKLDVFNIWFYIVIGIGLSKVAKIDPAKSIIIAFIPFVLYVGISVLFS